MAELKSLQNIFYKSMRKSRIICIEIFQTTEELHWKAKFFER